MKKTLGTDRSETMLWEPEERIPAKNHESKRMRFNLFFSSSRKAFKMTKKDVPQETLEMVRAENGILKITKSMSREREKKGKEEEEEEEEAGMK